MAGRLKAFRESAALFYRQVMSDDVFITAASIAYTAILSFFPLMIGLIALLSRFVEQAQARRAIVSGLAPYLPPGVVSLVEGILDAAISARAAAPGAVSLVAILGLFWAATAAASTLRHSLNRILGAPRARSFFHRKGIELAMVALAGGLLSLSLISSAVEAVVSEVPALSEITGALERSPIASAAATAGPWLLSGAALIIVYRFLPNVRVRWRSLLAGSLTGVVLFEATKQGFFWYLRSLARYPLIYSYLVGVVVFMIWIYLAAVVFLVGAEVIGHLERAGRRADADTPHA